MKAIRFSGVVLIQFWVLCVKIVVTSLTGFPLLFYHMSPYEKLYGKKHVISHMRTLGCLCHAKIVQQINKLQTRIRECVRWNILEPKKFTY